MHSGYSCISKIGMLLGAKISPSLKNEKAQGPNPNMRLLAFVAKEHEHACTWDALKKHEVKLDSIGLKGISPKER